MAGLCFSLQYYARDGHTNPAWDAAVKKTFELDGIRADVKSPDERTKNFEDERKAIKDALDAGCNDPDFLCAAGLFASDSGVPADQVFALFR